MPARIEPQVAFAVFTLRALALLIVAGSGCGASSEPVLRFSAPDGQRLNEFYRSGPVSAHLLLTSGTGARLVVAFPAGNSGTALWFDAQSADFGWQPDIAMEPSELRLTDGSVLRGVRADLVASGGGLVVRQAILGNVRVIRDFGYTGTLPAAIEAEPAIAGNEVVWQRRRLDGAAGYRLAIEVRSGSIRGGNGHPIAFEPGGDGRLRLRLTALTGDAPLTPIDEDELLSGAAAGDDSLRRILAFLSYREKLLAGSWRFNTYFGRDTLMSLRLLAPVLSPQVMEAGLGAVLARLDEAGEVAHEEDIGEYAVLRRIREGKAPDDAPLFDYKMIDDDFMLAPAVAHYLLDTAAGRERASGFLAVATPSGEAHGAALIRNFRFVLAATEPFAGDPGWTRLIALKPGESVGNWRDSEAGLGGGRYPFDVNAVLAPAALQAIARLHVSGLLEPYVDGAVEAALARAGAMAATWLQRAPPLFDVEVAGAQARGEAADYARSVGVDPAPAIAALPLDGLQFHGIALDAAGRPVPVLHSDEAFVWLFLKPSAEELERVATTLMRPFPAGLMTGAGLLVANPAFAPAELEPDFDRRRYHGTVIWSWQQAMLAAGLERQLARAGLPASTRAKLADLQFRLREVIGRSAVLRGSELWSWSQVAGEYRVASFDPGSGHETESNAAQLWSTVHLALTP